MQKPVANLPPDADENSAAYQFDTLSSELEKQVYQVLRTYSNIHRGSGYNSKVSTMLFDEARVFFLQWLGLDPEKFVVIFCSPYCEAKLISQIKQGSYQSISSKEVGLPLGVRVLAVRRKNLSDVKTFHSGGGTARLVSPGWIIWAKPPVMFEAGTPSIINVLTLARALSITKKYGKDAFNNKPGPECSLTEILEDNNGISLTGMQMLEELRKTHIGRDVLVPAIDGTRLFINLDNAASTPTFEAIWNVVSMTWRQQAIKNTQLVEKVRSICAGFLGAPLSGYDILFTGNATEALNLAADSLALEEKGQFEPVVLTTILEHTSNDLPWRRLPGISVVRLTVNEEGFIDLNELENVLKSYNRDKTFGRKRIRIFAITGASNVLGVFNNLTAISETVHRFDVRLLVDGAQLVAHRTIEMEKNNIDYLAFSGHKVYAPFGTGVLVSKKGLLRFSNEEFNLIKASGEENLAGIAALGKSLLILGKIGLDLIAREEKQLLTRALDGMNRIKGLTVYGIKDPQSTSFDSKGGVISFSMKGIWPDRLARKLSSAGIGVRYGCHCAHILVKHILHVPRALEKFQHVMLTLLKKISLPGVVRISIGIENTEADIDTLLDELKKIAVKQQVSREKD